MCRQYYEKQHRSHRFQRRRHGRASVPRPGRCRAAFGDDSPRANHVLRRRKALRAASGHRRRLRVFRAAVAAAAPCRSRGRFVRRRKSGGLSGCQAISARGARFRGSGIGRIRQRADGPRRKPPRRAVGAARTERRSGPSHPLARSSGNADLHGLRRDRGRPSLSLPRARDRQSDPIWIRPRYASHAIDNSCSARQRGGDGETGRRGDSPVELSRHCDRSSPSLPVSQSPRLHRCFPVVNSSSSAAAAAPGR